MKQTFKDFLKLVPKEDYWSLEDYAKETDSTAGKQKTTLRFASMAAMIQAAWNLTEFYKGMYELDLIYPGDLRKSIFFHYKTGNLVFKDVTGFKKAEKEVDESSLYNEYRAPELVLGKENCYSEGSENWTLAVLLYELFFHSGSPLRGLDSFRQVFLDPKEEYVWMAEKGMFTMEDNLCKNRAVHGVQDRLIKYWDNYPQVLRDAFTEVFVDGKEDIAKRKSPVEWEMVLNQVKTQFIVCSCGASGFIHDFARTPEGHYKCSKCSNVFYVFESGEDRLYLTEGTKILRFQIYKDETLNDECIGMVVENRQKKGIFGIKNMSDLPWKGLYPDGEEKVIPPGGGVPLWRGLKITFPLDCIWSIKGENSNG